MIKKLLIITLFLTTVLNAQIIDAKQLFNKKIVKVKKKKLLKIKVFME